MNQLEDWIYANPGKALAILLVASFAFWFGFFLATEWMQ